MCPPELINLSMSNLDRGILIICRGIRASDETRAERIIKFTQVIGLTIMIIDGQEVSDC